MFGHDALNSLNIGSLLLQSENIVFNATEFDIEKEGPILGTVKAKWVEATQTYHYKAFGMDDYADTGKKDADQVKNSTIETQVGSVVHSVASKINAGQGLEFESLSPADSGTPDAGDANGDGDANDGANGDGNGDSNGSNGDTDEDDDDEGMGFGTIALIGLVIGAVGYYTLK